MSWEQLVLLTGLGCSIVGIVLSFSKHTAFKVVCLLLIPLVVADGLYWVLAYVESGGTPSEEYRLWEGIVVSGVAATGYFSILLAFGISNFILAKRRATNNSHENTKNTGQAVRQAKLVPDWK